MANTEIYDKYIKLLEAVNNETLPPAVHRFHQVYLNGWLEGVEDAIGRTFNGDYYYIEKGVDRPMCAGEFLDWEYKP